MPQLASNSLELGYNSTRLVSTAIWFASRMDARQIRKGVLIGRFLPSEQRGRGFDTRPPLQILPATGLGVSTREEHGAGLALLHYGCGMAPICCMKDIMSKY